MRRTTLALALLALPLAGCATLRGPVEVAGPEITIHNEAHRLLELSYRCVENGPARRLGTVAPMQTVSFVLRPASCRTVYLVRDGYGVQHPDPPAFAVLPLLGRGSLEVVIGASGLVMRQEGASVRPAATPGEGGSFKRARPPG